MKAQIFPGLITIVFLLLVGSIFYNQVEGWSYVDSFYFSTITLTTIGYGDLVPTTTLSKIFTSFYALIGVGAMLFLLSVMSKKYIFERERNFIKRVNAIRENRKKK